MVEAAASYATKAAQMRIIMGFDKIKGEKFSATLLEHANEL